MPPWQVSKQPRTEISKQDMGDNSQITTVQYSSLEKVYMSSCMAYDMHGMVYLLQ